ncbi:hypothetical protein Q1W73_10380 [Asticcacaulis sp. ZE23SCel15]|uniref:hypothetical protein n=1 Tax=Asticcacaulis sp. ZE23SCel15 TaxID=3059027 RepID=UPI00265DCD12|nr:hypothetical protein [Asticcacaulis sp. ZE23SCel15]WKL56107.1 hypothetical protein Q1W73_10380 [Asticcacaulis sp. ZE23SCel15]
MKDSATVLTLPIDYQIEAINRFKDIMGKEDISTQSHTIHKTLEILFNKLQMDILDIKSGALGHTYSSEEYDRLLADITKLRSISDRLYRLSSVPEKLSAMQDLNKTRSLRLKASRNAKGHPDTYGIRINASSKSNLKRVHG